MERGAYADVADFPGLVGEAQRLSELRLTAVEARIEADLTLGRHAALIGELESLTTEYPLRESLRAKQMLALYREGRQADALRAFRRTEEYLREELGIAPSTELQELESVGSGLSPQRSWGEGTAGRRIGGQG